MIALVTIACLCFFGSVDSVLPYDGSVQIDLYTNKAPYDGKGKNARSDSFAPGEEVIIHVFASHYGYGIRNVLVAFEIRGPLNQASMTVMYRTALTNETGIATVDFRLPYGSDVSFGEWTVLGRAEIAGITLNDSTAFKVGWIVQIESIKTVDQNGADQLKFTRGFDFGLLLALESIAMTEKRAVIALTACDSMKNLINSTEIESIVVPSIGSSVLVHVNLQIPSTASLGIATVYVCIYTNPLSQGGAPYCPEATTNFSVVTREVRILAARKSTVLAYEGETVCIEVTVQNSGTEAESLKLCAYSNESLVSTERVPILDPHSQTALQFRWNTSGYTRGLYHISIHAEIVPGDWGASSDLFDAGFVEIRSRIHDIVLTRVAPESSVMNAGGIYGVKVTVRNQGNYVESFSFTLYYNTEQIETVFVDDLEPDAERTLTVQWNTYNVPEGRYTLSAVAVGVQDEADSTNNIYTDGTVEIRSASSDWPETNLTELPWSVVLAGLAAALLIMLVFGRRCRKTRNDPCRGWVSWYYGFAIDRPTKKPRRPKVGKK